MERAPAPDRFESPFRQAAARRDDAPAPARAGAPSTAAAAAVSPLPGLRGLTGYEEELLESARAGDNTAALCNELLSRCLVTPGGDPTAARALVGELLVAERDRALVELRRLSFGEEVESEIDCPACGEANELSFRLGDLPLDFPRPPAELDVALPSGESARLRLATAGDQAELLGTPAASAAERRTALLARVLVRRGAAAGPFGEADVRAMSIADRRAMEEALDAATPALDLSMGLACHACRHEFSAPFDFESFFLLR
jgi:hypothetical protein